MPSITYNTNTHSASFSGTNQGFSTGASAHNAISNGWTIEFMFKQTSLQDPTFPNQQYVLGRGDTLVKIVVAGGTYLFLSTPGVSMLAGSVSDGQWHRISIVIGSVGGDTSVYIDGSFSTSSAGTTSFTASTADFIVGLSSSIDDYKGKLDDVRLWSTQRTPTEIDTYKTAELQGNETGLEMYLKLNNGLADATGNHTFTNSGATFTTDYGFQNNVNRPIVRSVATISLND